MTPHRTQVLAHLTGTPSALSASDIYAALPHINLVTIYRTLEYLVTNRAVKKVHLNGDEAFFEVQHEPHHHAICKVCGKVIHFTTQDSELIKEFKIPGFIIDALEVTIGGQCKTHKDLHKK